MKILLNIAVLFFLVSCQTNERNETKNAHQASYEEVKFADSSSKCLQHFQMNILDDQPFTSVKDSIEFFKLVNEILNCAESKSSYAWEKSSAVPKVANLITDTSGNIPLNKKMDILVLLSFNAKHLTDQVQSAVRSRIGKGGVINGKNSILLFPLFTERCRASYSIELLEKDSLINVPHSYTDYVQTSLLSVETFNTLGLSNKSEKAYFSVLKRELTHEFFSSDYRANFGTLLN